jgi:hypothetical protein
MGGANPSQIQEGRNVELTRFKRWAVEGGSMAIADIVREFKTSRRQAVVCRDLAYLSAEPDLADTELLLISHSFTLAGMNRCKEAAAKVLPIMTMRFKGANPRAVGGPLRARQLHVDRFTQTVTSVTDSIAFLEEIFVPYMAMDDRKKFLSDLSSAGSTLRRIRKTIELGGSQNDKHQ